MNFIPRKTDTIVSLIKKRIKFFKDVHERSIEVAVRHMCQVKISTLEMVLSDISTLKQLKSSSL